jgi:hypothetical protein
VNSLTEKSDVGGWQWYSGQWLKNGHYHGEGKMWMDCGETFIGKFENDLIMQGKLS